VQKGLASEITFVHHRASFVFVSPDACYSLCLLHESVYVV
jgi:hypothetical protein